MTVSVLSATCFREKADNAIRSRTRLCWLGHGPEQALADTRSHSVLFRWEVFNVPNLKRFDVATITTGIDQGPAFGTYSGLLTNPRVMQFALRFEF